MQSRLSSLKQKPKYTQDTFQAIGTHWQIELWGLASSQGKAVCQKIRDRITIFEATYSRFRDDSLIARMAENAGMYTLPDDAKRMLDMYQKMYHFTGGDVTPLIGQALSDAGYDKNYSLQPKSIQTVPTWEETMRYDFPLLEIKRPALLDFGGIGKGALIDIVSELIENEGAENFVVNAGGDMFCKNEQCVDVALQDPRDSSQAIGVAHILHGALCGSAGTYRHWAQFTHILNPHTLKSPKQNEAVWVYAASALEADALTTALYFASASDLCKHFRFEYAIIKAGGSLEVSNNFPAEIFTSSKGKK